MHLGTILPLFDLLEVLGEAPVPPEDDGIVRVMIVEYKHRLAAYVVSDFLSPQKIVISEFDGIHVPGLSGTAVLSGRQLAMVVDLPRLFDLTFGTDQQRDVGRGPGGGGGEDMIPLGEAAAGPDAALVAEAEAPETEPVDEAEPTAPPTPSNEFESGDDLFGESHDEEFLQEVASMLARLNKQLLALDDNRQSDEADAVFRLVHSIKGNLTMYGAESAASFTHRIEALLEQARTGDQELTDEVFDVLFDGCSHLEQVVEALLKGQAPPEPAQRVVEGLERYEQAPAAAVDKPSEDWRTAPVVLDSTAQFYLSSRRREGAALYRVQIEFDPADQPAFLVAYLILRRMQRVADVMGTLPAMSRIETGQCDGRMVVLASPRDSSSDIMDRLGENLKSFFGVSSWDVSQYA
jgi:HPt (histidine-containing phosphotransfer) domain-containing protein